MFLIYGTKKIVLSSILSNEIGNQVIQVASYTVGGEKYAYIEIKLIISSGLFYTMTTKEAFIQLKLWHFHNSLSETSTENLRT